MTEIRTARVYEGLPPGWHPVLVDRLWPRGVSKEQLAGVTWLKRVGPSDELRQWFGHDPARFEEFAERYRAELVGDNAHAFAELLDEVRGFEQVVLLYSAHDADHNQAVVLAGMLRKELD
ncbi:DUF488 domain-containing protein [Aestuariimicrobium sp. Y1814]|uniref:DUF488 domain-containing protein n=1 Tax=Aestuariimicrobium sp. Y1814 TaxID=3418742 RepID=UPI003DA7576B